MNTDSKMMDIREHEASRIIAKLIDDKQNILIIGPSWGRDSYYLTKIGKNIINFDIAKQKHLKNFVLGDATSLPFKDRVFDGAVLAEVIEHLYEDFIALKEARRVLKNDGSLILTTPFYNDETQYHVRIYSPKTIQRLLSYIGFQITDYIERGGLITLSDFIMPIFHHFKPVQKIMPKIFDKITEFDYNLGKSKYQLLSKSKYYGCYIKAKKGNTTDFRQINVEEFSNL